MTLLAVLAIAAAFGGLGLLARADDQAKRSIIPGPLRRAKFAPGIRRTRQGQRRLRIDFDAEPEEGPPIPSDPQAWVAGAPCANPKNARIYNGLLCAEWPGYDHPIWVRIFRGNRVGGQEGQLPDEITDQLWGLATKDANGNWVFADPNTRRWEPWGKGKPCSPELEHQTVVGFWDVNDPETGLYDSEGPHTRVCFGKDDPKWHDPDDFGKCSSKTAAIVAAPWMAGGELGYELHHRYCKPYDGPKNT